MGPPGPVERVAVGVVAVRPGRRGHGVPQRGEQALVASDDVDDRVEECEEAVPRGGAGTERGWPVLDGVLQRERPLLHQRRHQPEAAAEAVEHRALPDAGRRRDLLHRDLLRPEPGEQLLGGLQDRAPVPRGIGTFGHRMPLPRQLDRQSSTVRT
jgi:hypothetical protein